MAMAVIRFDMRAPCREPADARELYAAALDMAAFADECGFDMLVLSEHHGAEDGYLPSPLVMAAAIAGRTKRIPLNVAALLVPLHDPLRLAEDIAVLDLVSGGRISIVAGLGYRPVEYEMFDQEWSRRGRRLDECLDTLMKAWTGEPFDYHGKTVRVTPRPLQQPHPMVLVGGSGKKAAQRAARFGLGFFPAVGDDSLVDLYYAECERLGRPPGFVALPSGPGSVFVAEDPEKAWAEVGPYLLHDAITYASWQTAGIRSHVLSRATTVEELRAEGTYQILTPEQCIETARSIGPMGAITHHPLCGGTPPELAWESLRLFAEKVLPAMRAG
ncbi:MAG: LLM class flavin-dependent oxidoreductase [Acidimicrobiales bacterium]|nr:LLM class flavin-dependent oxidoreductase [Acidimicrobiales bacterium]